jgi:hypothetical protein
MYHVDQNVTNSKYKYNTILAKGCPLVHYNLTKSRRVLRKGKEGSIGYSSPLGTQSRAYFGLFKTLVLGFMP